MKNYILDTTVLLYDSQALFAFDDNNVIVPINVIEDIDRFKKELTETGTNARQTSRYLDEFRREGSLATGVRMRNGGMVSVKIGTEEIINRLPLDLRHTRNNILAIALAIKEEQPGIPTIIVSKDINLRIKGDTLGLKVEDYESEKVDVEELYPGYCSSVVDSEKIETLTREGAVELDEEYFPNEYIALHNENMSLKTLGRYDGAQKKVVRIDARSQGHVWRIEPRNREQVFAMDALLNDSIQLVTLIGKAGTGKTLLAIASSLYKTVDENSFNRVLVSRPTQPMGKDIGYLPGTIEEKLFPWMYPIADNVEFLTRSEGKSKRHLRGFKELTEMGILIIEPLTYIRGRSIHNQYLIVDEAQNLTPHELKTIVTRVGDGTKIVVTGDPYQIDNPYIDSSSNGLSYIVEKFKKQDIAAHVTLTKGERSKLSELAANLL
ncbi:MAG: AAA family ATPase [Chitinivibrionales bacterium]|nr:AAA family ATPase [Chitinivibrionales bacterium]